jgi:uncharacterized protein
MRNPYDWIGRLGMVLAIIGAIDWLIIGLFQYNVVARIFGGSGTMTVTSVGERIVYIVVGVGGVIAVPMLGATLARARSRDLEDEEPIARDRRAAEAGVGPGGIAYQHEAVRDDLGAPQEERPAASRDDRLTPQYGESVAAQENAGADRSLFEQPATGEDLRRPVRREERVIIRTEEPIEGEARDAGLGADEGLDEQGRRAA